MPRLTHILVAAVAASTLAASTAVAKPTVHVDRYDSPTSSLAGTTGKQDLRGEHAQDAARLAALPQDLRGEHARDAARFNGQTAKPPVHWAYDYEASTVSPKHVSAPAPKPSSDGDDLWLVLAIALGATGIVAGSVVAVTRRSRIRVAA